VVVITMVSMIMPIIGVQPLPARGGGDYHRPVIVGRRPCHGAVTFRTARCAAVRCQRDSPQPPPSLEPGGGSFSWRRSREQSG
jgi:hypothetical protein